MLEGMTGLMRRYAHRRDRLTVKIIGRKKVRPLCRIVMVAQLAGDFRHRYASEAGAVKDFARGLRAGQARIHGTWLYLP